MKSTKLISALSILLPDEWTRCKKYLLNHTTKQSDAYQLFIYLYKQKAHLQKIDLQVIQKKVFPSSTEKAVSNISSRLHLWVENFLVQDHILQNKDRSDVILSQIYNRRGQYNLSNQTGRRLEKSFSGRQEFSLEKTLLQAELYYYQYFSDNPIKIKEKGKLLERLILKQKEVIYQTVTLLLTEAHNRNDLVELDLEIYIDPLLQISELTTIRIEPLELLKQVVLEKDPNAFYTLLQLLKTGGIKKSDDLHQIITFYLVSYSLLLWRSGSLKSPDDVLEAYSYGLNSGVLFSGGKMPLNRFHNMIGGLATYFELHEGKKFIETCMPFVDTTNTQSTFALALSQLYFYKECYDDIISQLNMAQFYTYGQKRRYYTLMIISHFKTKPRDYIILYTLLKNFKRFNLKNKMTGSLNAYRANKNFISIIELLLKQEIKPTKINLSRYKYLSRRKWLMNEIKTANRI